MVGLARFQRFASLLYLAAVTPAFSCAVRAATCAVSEVTCAARSTAETVKNWLRTGVPSAVTEVDFFVSSIARLIAVPVAVDGAVNLKV